MNTTRRTWLGSCLGLTALTSLRGQDSFRPGPICVFTKGLQSLNFEDFADQIATIGVNGVEATIREGGHIEPEAVPDALPKMVEALAARNLEITVMASSINDPKAPHVESTLRTAARLGIKRYRLKYFTYDADKPIRDQLANWQAQLEDLAAMNRELGMRGLYQNHAGEKYFGAGLWDLATVLETIPAEDLAVAFDIRHATAEAGTSWPIAFRRLRDHIDTVYAKDFVWDGPKIRNVPLGAGRVDYPKFVKLLKATSFRGPISLHVEYIDHRDASLVGAHVAANRRDAKRLRAFLDA